VEIKEQTEINRVPEYIHGAYSLPVVTNTGKKKHGIQVIKENALSSSSLLVKCEKCVLQIVLKVK
jgi:hypothetical protein